MECSALQVSITIVLDFPTLFLSSSKSSLPMNTHINLRTNACTKKHILIVGKFVLAKRDM